MLREILCRNIKGSRGESFFLRNVDAANPCAFHADECDEICAFIRDSNVHGLADFLGLLLCCGNYAARIFKRYACFLCCSHSFFLRTEMTCASYLMGCE